MTEEPDLIRASAWCARDVPFLALKMMSSGLGTSKANAGGSVGWLAALIEGTSPLSRRDLRTESFFRRDFFPDSSSSRRTDAKEDGVALGSPVGRNIGLIGSPMSSMTSASGIPPCCACLIFMASFEGFEWVDEDVDLLTEGGRCEEFDFGRGCVDFVETGEGVDLDSSVGGGNEGGRPETPRDIRLPKDWYEVVIAVVAVGPFPIGVTNLVRTSCS